MPRVDPKRWTQVGENTYTRDPDAVNPAFPFFSYEGWVKADLIAELDYRGLSKTGNKQELIARLKEADAA